MCHMHSAAKPTNFGQLRHHNDQANPTNLTETVHELSQNNGDVDQSLAEDETVRVKVGTAMFILMPCASDCDLPHTDLAKLYFS